MKPMLFVLLSLFLCTPSFAQEGTVLDTAVLNSRVDTNVQIVGGLIAHKITWPADAGLELMPVDSANAFVLVSTTYDTTDLLHTATFTYLLTDTGALVVPTVQAVNTTAVYTTPADTVLARFLPAQDGVEKAEARPLADVPFNIIWWLEAYWYWIAIGVALLLLGYLIWRYLKRPKKAPVAPLAPEPDYYKEAIEAIAALRTAALWESDMKGFYVSLGDVVRTYLTHSTGLPLAEQTTSESVRLLYQKWTAAQIESYQFILTRADHVKFAKGSWDVDVHYDCLDKAAALITDFKTEQDV
ncbi:MAG: DUF4381 domain-containing protein [Schleiferiaceae bacterium]|nr:DUF4381 domain-containing protein [Schleiferiaceae bacterium]